MPGKFSLNIATVTRMWTYCGNSLHPLFDCLFMNIHVSFESISFIIADALRLYNLNRNLSLSFFICCLVQELYNLLAFYNKKRRLRYGNWKKKVKKKEKQRHRNLYRRIIIVNLSTFMLVVIILIIIIIVVVHFVLSASRFSDKNVNLLTFYTITYIFPNWITSSKWIQINVTLLFSL